MAKRADRKPSYEELEKEVSRLRKKIGRLSGLTPKEMAENAVVSMRVEPKANRNAKDSVFVNLFGRIEYLFQLYQSLHPEDTETRPSDLTIATLESHLVNQQYNDLAFLVRNRILILLEAQSSWSVNIVIRVFLYLANLWLKYINANKLDIYGSKALELPVPEFYVVYTGKRKSHPGEIRLNDAIFGGKDIGLDLRVKMLYGGESHNILDQYIAFTKILNGQFKMHGRTRNAVQETIRICLEQNVLTEYLREAREEVLSIMDILFDDKTILANHIISERRESARKARERAEKAMQKEIEAARNAARQEAEAARNAARQEAERAEKAVKAETAMRDTLVTAIRNLMKSANCNMEQAMDVLGIVGNSRAIYASML